MRAAAVMVITAASLLLSACASEDKGRKPYQDAVAIHERLLLSQTPPADPAYDAVLRKLEEVPNKSQWRGRADALRKAIDNARMKLPSRPLARGTGPSEGPEIQAQRAQCEEAAKALGTAPPAERPRRLTEMRLCQEKLERMLAAHTTDASVDAGVADPHRH